MIREVNLIDHLPLYVQDYREIQAIMNAENPELQLIDDASETIKDNMFVVSTDEVGIERHEKMFGLTPAKNDTLANRQAKVLSQYTNTVIYTMRGLIERLNVICGADNYTLRLIPDEYRIDIILHIRKARLYAVIKSMLIDMLPANMLYNVSILYNTHSVLAKYPMDLLMQFTHQELFDVSIEGNISATCEDVANHTAESLESISCETLLNFGTRKV